MEQAREFSVGQVTVGGRSPLFLIAGPCVIESESHCTEMARRLATIAAELNLPVIFKASYDKANRSSLSSYRGPGLTEGLRILGKIKERFGLPILPRAQLTPPPDARAVAVSHRGPLVGGYEDIDVKLSEQLIVEYYSR
mgnify:CR=1 FL=1